MQYPRSIAGCASAPASATPFLSIVTESHAFGTPESADAFVWTHYALPDDQRTTSILTSAADAISVVLDNLDRDSPSAQPVLQAIVRLPQNIRAQAARGLSPMRPLPGYGVQAMNPPTV